MGVSHPSITDAWLTSIGTDETFTHEILDSIADLWHRMVENYPPDVKWGTSNIASGLLRRSDQISRQETDSGLQEAYYAYLTLSMSLEVKAVALSRCQMAIV